MPESPQLAPLPKEPPPPEPGATGARPWSQESSRKGRRRPPDQVDQASVSKRRREESTSVSRNDQREKASSTGINAHDAAAAAKGRELFHRSYSGRRTQPWMMDAKVTSTKRTERRVRRTPRLRGLSVSVASHSSCELLRSVNAVLSSGGKKERKETGIFISLRVDAKNTNAAEVRERHGWVGGGDKLLDPVESAAGSDLTSERLFTRSAPGRTNPAQSRWRGRRGRGDVVPLRPDQPMHY